MCSSGTVRSLICTFRFIEAALTAPPLGVVTSSVNTVSWSWPCTKHEYNHYHKVHCLQGIVVRNAELFKAKTVGTALSRLHVSVQFVCVCVQKLCPLCLLCLYICMSHIYFNCSTCVFVCFFFVLCMWLQYLQLMCVSGQRRQHERRCVFSISMASRAPTTVAEAL